MTPLKLLLLLTASLVLFSACSRDGDDEGKEEGNALCTDGIDNDDDGLIDCFDDSCNTSAVCMYDGGGIGGGGGTGGGGGVDPSGSSLNNESTDTLCSNGLDDDGDGFADCKDYHCLYNPAVTVCGDTLENSNAKCADGVDNDGNNHMDCDDFSCSRNPYVTVCGQQENTDALCSDGQDNDGNNFSDCDDFGCSKSPIVSVCGTSEAGFCMDGLDNDGDGQADCDDADCATAAAHCTGGEPVGGGGGTG
ncbi:hypothetical protein KKB55_13035, partial [Myxococcota bacterium]|nr:hypothetical protein [Myxococcota bacterium]MBU1898665.1 hypothetical protein [Myxococcota bacterium]